MGNIKSKQEALEPKRFEYAVKQLEGKGVQITAQTDRQIEFLHNGQKVTFYPYTGWHTGKTIKDGRGIHKLLKQL